MQFTNTKRKSDEIEPVDARRIKKKEGKGRKNSASVCSVALSPGAPAVDGRGVSRDRGGASSAVEKQEYGGLKKRLRVILFTWRRRLQQASLRG